MISEIRKLRNYFSQENLEITSRMLPAVYLSLKYFGNSIIPRFCISLYPGSISFDGPNSKQKKKRKKEKKREEQLCIIRNVGIRFSQR